MIMTSTALLALMLGNFIFETKVNQLRVYNGQDRIQARLNAEAGLNFAIAKLKLYKAGRNVLEKNESMKDFVDARQLEMLLIQEFAAPLEEAIFKKATLNVRSAVTKFNKSILLDGNVSVTMSPISGFLNPNNMRVKNKKPEDENQNGFNQPDDDDNDNKKDPPHVYVEKELTKALEQAWTQERERNEQFDLKYGNIQPSLLIKELKYYVSHPDDFQEVERGEIEGNYNEDGTIPKHAPLRSLSELYLLKGWDDQLVDLLKDKMTVHEVTYIQVNEITKRQLSLLFPEVQEEQLDEFFKLRDGDPQEGTEPRPFKNSNEFKDAVVNQLGYVDETSYNERIKEFENAGIKLGVAGKLYKVTSRGSYGRSSYTIEAYVDLPVLPEPKVLGSGSGSGGNTLDPNDPNNPIDPNDPNNQQTNNTNQNGQQQKKLPLELMEPRVIEMQTL